MSDLQAWSNFLEKRAKAPPLTFVHGMCHRVLRGSSCAAHSHPSIEIVYHPTGAGVTRVEGVTHLNFEEGSAVIYVPHQLHDQVIESDGEDLCVQIAVPKTVRQLPRTPLYVSQVSGASLREDLRLLSRGHPRLSRTEQAIFNLRSTAVLLGLIQSACECRSHEEADLTERHCLKAERYIREHFASIEALSEVALHVGVSHDYLRHIFKLRRGKPLVRHLGEVRIERAKMLLTHSRLPMKQIAILCGFKDEYYFSAVFRRYASSPPGAHRQESL